ncbi:MAG: extradiol ring-cleavage dioxygenase [Candidatus Tectimicrobiota bacterium]
MADLLGIGMTHYPGLIGTDTRGSTNLARALRQNTRIPAAMKEPQNWPEELRREFGDDEGLSATIAHRQRLVEGFRKLRAEIDAFQPDFLLIWGDDQYENFQEDIIPPFCVLAWEEIHCQPLKRRPSNIWGEPQDKEFHYTGCPRQGRYLATRLLEHDIDMAYAYKPLHEAYGLGHAFVNTLLFLDYDRTGLPYPVLPFQVNCYGSRVIRNHGGAEEFSPEPDPPGPSPRRCMEVGAATARILRDSPWRVAMIASSSWSHAFLTEKTCWLHPDIEADRARFAEFQRADWDAWRHLTTEQIEASGQQEMLNWFCLAGAMEALGRKPQIIDWVESWVNNSNKCLAVFQP